MLQLSSHLRPERRLYPERTIIDLDLVDAKPVQVAQGGVFGPEIIKRDPDAALSLELQAVNALGVGLQQDSPVISI